jgi:DNA-nicking Smr family endonuclease
MNRRSSGRPGRSGEEESGGGEIGGGSGKKARKRDNESGAKSGDRQGDYGNQGAPSQAGRRAGGQLSAEDRQLWEKVAMGLKPLRRRSLISPKQSCPDDDGDGKREKENPPHPQKPYFIARGAGDPGGPDLSSGHIGGESWKMRAPAPTRPASARHAHASPAPARHGASRQYRHDGDKARKTAGNAGGGFSRRELRRLARSDHHIEARLDLHGMRQGEAHAALSHFIIECYNQGRRYVLVITGKGRGPSPMSGLFAENETGVLRRNVPLWLEEPQLRSFISSTGPAARRHGGEGAILVRIRRRPANPANS